jgi:AraC-like DNA-binding protein
MPPAGRAALPRSIPGLSYSPLLAFSITKEPCPLALLRSAGAGVSQGQRITQPDLPSRRSDLHFGGHYRGNRSLSRAYRRGSRTLSVEALAERIGMSPRHFSRVCLREMKMNPRQFVDRLRVEAAQHCCVEIGESRSYAAFRILFTVEVHLKRRPFPLRPLPGSFSRSLVFIATSTTWGPTRM